MKRIAGRSCQNFAPRLIRQPLVNFPDPPAAASWSRSASHQRTSRQPLVNARARARPVPDPPAAGHGSRFKIQRPAGQDPATSWPRSAASWSRSAAQIRQPLAQIRDQLAAFFVLGPQHIGSFYAGPDRENLKKSPRPAVVQTLARAMFRTNIYVKNRTMFHVKQCTINRQTTEFLLTAQKPCILCT